MEILQFLRFFTGIIFYLNLLIIKDFNSLRRINLFEKKLNRKTLCRVSKKYSANKIVVIKLGKLCKAHYKI